MAVVAVLLAVAVTGLRARGTFAHGGNQTAAGVSGAVLATALSAAEGLAVIAFVIVVASARPQRQPKDDDDEELWRPNIPWWAKTVGVLLAVAALVTPFAVLFTRKPRQLGPRPLPGGPPKVSLGHAATSSASDVWPLIIGMVIAIAIVVAFTLLGRRKRSARTQPRNRKARAWPRCSTAWPRAAPRSARAANPGPRSSRVTRPWNAGSPRPDPRPRSPTPRPRCWPAPPGPAWSGRSRPRR